MTTPAPTLRWKGHRRVGLAVADQVVASAGNALVTFLVARWATGEELGRFTLAFAAYTVAVAVSRAAVSDVVSVEDPHGQSIPARDALGTAVGVGIVSAVVCVVLAVAVHDVGTTLLVLSVWLPVLVTQDAARTLLIVRDRLGGVLVNDLAWTAATAASLLLVGGRGISAATAVAWWAGTGVGAALLGWAQLHTLPAPTAARRWWADHRSLVTPFVTEQLLSAAGRPLALAIAAAVAGLTVPGDLQAAYVVFGPLVALQVAVPFVGYSEAARYRRRGGRTTAVGAGVAVVLAAVVTAWSVVLWVLPTDLLHEVFGVGYVRAEPVLAGTAALLLTVSVNLGALTVLRAERAATSSRRVRVVSFVLMIAAAVVGSAVGSAEAVAWALAVANALTVPLWWRAAHAAAAPATAPTGAIA